MERVAVDKLEDSCSEKLKVWCIRVRSSFLVCSNQEDVILGKPLSDGTFSPAMVKLMKESEILGISSLRDVQTVMNAFRSICWTAFAMQKLAKRSTLKDVVEVLKFCNAVGLGEEKVGKMLKGMIQKATLWQAKVRKALTPKFGERKPYNLEVLKNLEIAYRNMPFDIHEIACLENVIDDKGQRYCLCGGPSDGSFMLGCDKCDEWFHGGCVGVDKATSSSLQSWHCPRCKGETIDSSSSTFTEFQPIELPLVQNVQNDDWAPCAPTIDQIWPPFKSLQSPETVEAFGQECITTPDSCGNFEDLDGASILNNVENLDSILSEDTLFRSMKNVDSRSISYARNKETHFQVLSLPSILSVENNTCLSTTSESFSIVSIGATAIDSTQSGEKCTSDIIGNNRNDMLDELDLCQILPRSQNEPISMSIVPSTTVLVDDSESAHSEIAHTGISETMFPDVSGELCRKVDSSQA
jgi:PHD-finger